MSNHQENKWSDRALVQRVQGGDRHAIGLIIKQTEGLVAQLIFKMIPSPADRKDIAQDVYLKVFKNLAGFKFQSKLSTWVGQITYNTCLNYLKKKRPYLLNFTQENGIADDDLMDAIQLKQQGSLNNETEELMTGKELAAILNTEIARLPLIYQTLVTLYHQEEMSNTEIAEITSLPEGTIKNYLFRARKQLKENLLLNYKKEEL